MGLINTNGLVLIGPGSEWFWSMLQLVVVVVSLAALYRQLRAQGSANAVQRMDSLQGAWESERMIHVGLLVTLWCKQAGGTSPGLEAQAALASLCDFFENLSDLEEEGYLTWKEVENSWGQALAVYWTLLSPAILERRGQGTTVYPGFERLAQKAKASAAKRGDDWSFDPADIPDVLEGMIGRGQARLRILRDVAEHVIPVDTAPEAAGD
jgi:hypothetical protein